jgi:predicted Fe-Mo cluster-binding NifX family protein
VSKYGEYYLVNKLKDCVVVTRSTTLYSKEDFENVKSSIIVEGKSVERKEVKTVVEIAEKVRRAKLNTLVLNNLGKANYVIVFEDIETLKAQYAKISYFIKKHYRANWDERNNAGVDVCEFYLNDTRIQFVLNGFHAVGPCVVMQYKELV